MKLFLLMLLGILALNALVILFITGILVHDHFKARRRESKNERPANAS
jgi:hypothetical protein